MYAQSIIESSATATAARHLKPFTDRGGVVRWWNLGSKYFTMYPNASEQSSASDGDLAHSLGTPRTPTSAMLELLMEMSSVPEL